MSEPEATPAAEPPAPTDATPAPAFDASLIRGLQVFAPAAEAPAEGADDAQRREALAQLLATRAARIAEAVDDALTLANDGAIRWLGDPIGKLIAGAAPLEPRIALLADEALPPEGREAAERRLALWLAAHLRKALGPLIALGDAEGAPEAARSVGQKVSQAFGVLDRERVKAEVKALDQEARGVLRKLGVRFGAHYIYVPALLKPGARTLCAQLWALTQAHVEPDSVERLLHFAASGRTSFAIEPPASPELCRIAGFRLCGDRAVRVDIVERLSDLIRAALPRTPSPGPVDEADGFVVSGQMTSLTGCSGEPFATILRSLGFVPHQVKKSAHLAALARRAAALAAAAAPTAAVAPAPEAAAGDAASTETAASTEAPLVDAAAPPAAEVAVSESAEPAVPSESAAPEASPEIVAATESAAAPDAVEDAPAIASSPEAVEDAADVAAEPAVEIAAPECVSETEATPIEAATEAPEAADSVAAEAAAAETVSADAAPAEATTEAAPAEEEMIEVWRPAPRRPRHHQHHHRHDHHEPRRRPQGAAAAEGQGEGRAVASEGRNRKPWRGERPSQGPGDGQPQAGGEQRGEGRQGEGRRGPPPWRRDGAKGDRREERRDDRRADEGKRPDKGRPRPPPPEPRVNLDSPFAKLLDLKPLLQGRDKNQ